jgi:hypothetical protein
MFVCFECCVLSGRGFCDELITRPEESYRLWCVVVCDLETLRMRRPWPALGHSAKKRKSIIEFIISCNIIPGNFFSNNLIKIDVFFGDSFRSYFNSSFNKRSFRPQIGPKRQFILTLSDHAAILRYIDWAIKPSLSEQTINKCRQVNVAIVIVCGGTFRESYSHFIT